MSERLYVIVRGDLEEGPRAVQATHAAIDLCLREPEAVRAWFASSNTVAVLVARDEAHLLEFGGRASRAGVLAMPFREPDLDDSLTALALAPCAAAERICRGLPLLGSRSSVGRAAGS